MTIAAKREKLHEFAANADDKHIENIYNLMEDEITEPYDDREDEEFLQEIKSRIDDIESSDDEGFSCEEVKTMSQRKIR